MMETYINFSVNHVTSIKKANDRFPDVYCVSFNRSDDISIYGPYNDEVYKKFRHAVKTCIRSLEDSYYILMRIKFNGRTFDEFVDNVLNTGRVDGILTVKELDDTRTIHDFEITSVNPRTAFTINRAVGIRAAKSDDNKFLIFFERDEDWDWKPKIDIYSEDHDTIVTINKKLRKSNVIKRYYLVVYTSGDITEPSCKNSYFAVNGYINANNDVVITSYEAVNHKEENKMRKNCVTVEDVYKGMTDAQQKVCQFMIGEAIKDAVKSLTPDNIKKVIYNDPATIILWSDGTKTVVKCMEDEDYDPEKGFMAAVTKKVFGDKYGWVLRHHVKPAVENEKKVDALMNSIAIALHRKRTAKESAVCIRDQMILSGATNWELETFDRFVRKYIAEKEEK